MQAILRAIETGFPELTAKVLEAFVLDVFLYLRRVVVRDDINRLVRPHLATGPTVVVGHSLGSIVAYEVLRELPATPGVRLFVTVGSPLGLQVVRDWLVRGFPKPVAAWRNAYDERDVVALRPVEARHFGGPIENFNKVRNHTSNHHGIDGYLDDPVVAGWILDALS